MAIELEKAGEASVEKLGGDVRRAREGSRNAGRRGGGRGPRTPVYLSSAETDADRVERKEQNAETNSEDKNHRDIDENNPHQLTLEDKYYCLHHLKYNPLRLKIPLTHTPVQTEARQSPSTPSKSL